MTKRLIKILGIGVISLLAIIVVAATLLVTFVNPNHFKPAISKAFNLATNRTINLNGNISWSFYPSLGLKIESISIANPSDFYPEQNFLTVGSADVAVGLIPLLNHQISFDTLNFDHAQLNFMTDGKHNNWTFTQSNSNNQQSTTNPPKQKLTITLHNFALSNSQISYQNLLVANNKHSHALHKSQAIAIKKFVLSSGFDGGITIDNYHDLIDVDNININYNDILNLLVNLNINTNTLDSQGSLQLSNLNLNQLLLQITGASPALPLLNNVELSTNLFTKAHNLSLPNLKFSFAKTLIGNSQLKIDPNLNYNGKVQIVNLNLNKLATSLNVAKPIVANPRVLQGLDINSQFSGNNNSIRFTGLKIANDILNINGNLLVSSFAARALAENLVINDLDLADLVYINGFRVPIATINLNGTLSGTSLASLRGTQEVKLKQITILGFDLVGEIKEANNILKSDNGNILVAVNNNGKFAQIQDDFTSATKPGIKNLNLKTKLGDFTTTAIIKDGHISPSTFSLSAPNLQSHGNGSVNLLNKSIYYDINSRLNISGIDPIFNTLTFPAVVSGKMNDPHANLKWNYIISQLVTYFVKNNAKVINAALNKAGNNLGHDVNNFANKKESKKLVNDINDAAKSLGGLFK